MFACFCLNIVIKTGEDDLVGHKSSNFDDAEENDSFFQQEIMQVTKLLDINKVHSSLVRTRNVGQWNIHCCINCVCEVYAVHKVKGASCVLIYSKLRDTKSIEVVKSDVRFSKVFNIVIYPDDNRINNNVLKSYPNCDAEAIIKHLRQVMTECIKRESLAIEENINRYAEEQYEILNNFKDVTYKEHDSLVRFIQGLEEQEETESTKMVASTKSKRLTDQTFNNLNTSPLHMITKPTTKRQKSSPSVPVTSVDAEGLFDFEDSDGVYSQPGTDADESDREENVEGGISMPQKQRSANGSIAKSLPMNIPAFLSQARNHSTEDLDDLPQEDNLDIAASIKALARSVHGDAVFGELPRPRFSTQI